jgi:hypothetical protein
MIYCEGEYPIMIPIIHMITQIYVRGIIVDLITN